MHKIFNQLLKEQYFYCILSFPQTAIPKYITKTIGKKHMNSAELNAIFSTSIYQTSIFPAVRSFSQQTYISISMYTVKMRAQIKSQKKLPYNLNTL